MPAEFEGSLYKDPTKKAVWDPRRALRARGVPTAKNGIELCSFHHFSVEKQQSRPKYKILIIKYVPAFLTYYGCRDKGD